VSQSKKRVFVGLGCALAFLLVGCSSSDEGASPPLPIEQFPQQFSSALCEAIGPCCLDAALPYVAATCKRSATEDFTNQVTYAEGKLKYDAAAAGECLSQYKAALAKCQLPTELTASACAGIFKGALATGAACNVRLNECAVGYCQESLDASGNYVGKCVADAGSGSAPVPEGGRCDISPNCAEGLYCTFDSLCAKTIPLGGTCADYYACQKGTYCTSEGVCAAQHDSGPCGGATDFDACSDGSYCSSLDSFSGGECLKKKPDGYSCRSREECLNGLCNGTCGPASAATTTTCAGDFPISSSSARPDGI
jgi:hypothetical protein